MLVGVSNVMVGDTLCFDGWYIMLLGTGILRSNCRYIAFWSVVSTGKSDNPLMAGSFFEKN